MRRAVALEAPASIKISAGGLLTSRHPGLGARDVTDAQGFNLPSRG
jgi:hypothetical protein